MTGRKFLSALAAAALAASLCLGGCGKESGPAPEAYGVADLETLVKAHPAYADYFKAQSEYESLLSRYRSEQKSLFHLSETRKRMTEALSSATAEKAAEEEYKARVKIKEDELNRNLSAKYREISLRHEKTPDRMTMAGGAGEENTAIANLHLKLKFLNTTGEEKTEAQEALKDLLNSRYAESVPDAWTAEEKEEFARARKDAKAALSAYAASVTGEIRSRRAASLSAVSSEKLPDADQWNAEWESRIRDKQQEMAGLKARIMDDIRDKAAIVGEKKHLAMIFSSWRANVNAEDVTGDIVNELVKTG